MSAFQSILIKLLHWREAIIIKKEGKRTLLALRREEGEEGNLGATLRKVYSGKVGSDG